MRQRDFLNFTGFHSQLEEQKELILYLLHVLS